MTIAIPETARISLVALAPFALAPPGGGATVPNCTYVQQSENNWCWAACGQMLLPVLNLQPLTQCEIASHYLNLVCCPSPKAPVACDKGAWPEAGYNGTGLNPNLLQSPLREVDVQTQLENGRPVQVVYQWDGGGTHVALIVGYTDDGFYEVYDPFKDYGEGPRHFDEIQLAYGYGSWIFTYTY